MPNRAFSIGLGLVAVSLMLAAQPMARADVQSHSGSDEQLQFFESQVRPLLAEHCYKCHSSEARQAGKLKGGLLLDSREAIAEGGENGPALVPGKPEQSRLIAAIRWADQDLKMPPKERLTLAQVQVLEKWVAMGAPDPRSRGNSSPRAGVNLDQGRKWWSLAPLAPVAPPAVDDPGRWVRTPIDRFVLARLRQKRLKPNGLASRNRLIRRACLDLTGLPPTPAETAAFEADSSPDAYGRLIDRLLASRAYGERWARHWLDVARFAESDGFEHDSDRPYAYEYRDFVIRALNQDMPFNQFVQWQIAGDELAPDDWQAMAATGFLTAGVFPTQITEKEFEFTRYSQLDDMISTMGNAMLAMTIGCARCHDHKFDPISTRDYYRLAACFGAAIRSDVELPIGTTDQREAIRKHDAELAAARAALESFDREEMPKQFDAFLHQARREQSALAASWSVLDFSNVSTTSGMKLVKQPDGSLLKVGPTPSQDTYKLVARTMASRVTALRLEAMIDPSLPHQGPGAADNGNFSLSEIQVRAAPLDEPAAAAPVAIAAAAATHQQNQADLSVASSFDGKSNTGWAVDFGGIGKSQTAVFAFANPVGFAGGADLTIELHFDHPNPRHLIGRLRLAITSDGVKCASSLLPPTEIFQTINRLIAGQKPSDAREAAARSWVAATIPTRQALAREITRLETAKPAGPMAKVQVTSEGLPPVKNYADGRGYPHFYKTTYLLRRGDPNNKAEPVTAGIPQVFKREATEDSLWLSQPPRDAKTSYRRAGVARWTTDVDRGAGALVARVIVNRLWQHHLGSGIVATPNDFGAQGERPTHPELLDWLSSDLVSNGWRLKRLHKMIMTSSVYMQDSNADRDNEEIDPHNQWLWRWQPRRLEAEPARDSMLSVAGLLDSTSFGPGTLDQNMRRRSIYFTVKRSQLIPMMMVLDWPEALNSIGQRPVTTVAPQALLFLNSPQARQYAEAFSRRIASESNADVAENGYRIAFGRPPLGPEKDLAARFIDNQIASYKLSGVEDPRAMALSDFCQALLSSNEFIYVE